MTIHEARINKVNLFTEGAPRAIVALVTADPSPAVAERAARLGAVVLRKPVDPARLRGLLARPAMIAG